MISTFTQSPVLRRLALCIAAAALSMIVPLGAAHAAGLTREQGAALLEELRLIRKALEKQATATAAAAAAAAAQPGMRAAAPQPQQNGTSRVNIDGAYALGKADAPVTMVMFTDYQCPFCKNFETQTFAEIRKNWIDTGKLRFVVRDQPLDMHPDAMKAAEASRCAGEQGKYWELREKLIVNPEQLQRPRLSEYARSVGLDAGKFDACLDSNRHADAIKAGVVEAGAQRIMGTPSFVIAKSDGMVADGALVVGALPYGVFEQKLQELSAK